MFTVSFVAVAIVLFALIVLDFVDRHIPVRITKTIKLNVPGTSPDNISRYEKLLAARNVKVVNLEYSCDFENDQSTITLHVSARGGHLLEAISRLRKGAPEITGMKVG